MFRINKSENVAKNENGFTLIELMITVVIIGILAAIAIPQFMSYSTRAKMAEAKLNIGSIKTMMEVHFAENDTYFTSFTDNGDGTFTGNFNLADIGYTTPAGARYVYSVTLTSGTDYTIQATTAGGINLDSDNTDDVWEYSNSGANAGELRHTTDDSIS